jgi:His/Glu/Gln/Arg/opine family amino acid ABC transporter permease subunit
VSSSAGPYGRGEQPLSRSAASGLVLTLVGAAGAANPSFAVPVGLLAAAFSLRGLYEAAVGKWRGRSLARAGVAAGVVVAAGSFLWAANRRGEIDLSGLGQAYFRRDIIEVMWPAFARGALRTIQLAALAELAGILLGLVLALLVISNTSWVRLPARGYIDFFRGTPLLMQLLVISFGLPFIGIRLDPFPAGVIGLTLNSAAYVAEIFRAGIQSVDVGQVQAARSLGMPEPTAMIHVVIPQAVRRVIPPLMNEFIALLKDSSLVAVLGATIAERELLRVARDGAAAFVSATPYVMASIGYLLLTIPLTALVGRLEKRLSKEKG